MTSENQIESYLSTRASQVDLPHAGLDRITARARRRRNRKRSVRGGIAAVALLGGIAFVANQPEDAESVTNLANAVVVPSSLEWSVVPTDAGLGWSRTIVADDGAVYALSTAAQADPQGPYPPGRVVYRSDDGGEWEAVGLPDGLFASSLAASDGALYALGTTAAGGSAGPVDLAVTTDGGDTWDTTIIPFDAGAEHPDFPGEILVVGAEVAVHEGRTVVAVQVTGRVDVQELLGADDGLDRGWYPVATGLERAPKCPEVTGEDPVAPTTAPAGGPTVSAPVEDGAATSEPVVDAAGRSCVPDAAGSNHRSWAELGVDPSVGTLVTGYTVVLAGPSDGELTRVEDMSGTTYTGTTYAMGRSGSLVAADDGFWSIGHPIRDGAVVDVLSAWHSVDGVTWNASQLPGVEPDGLFPAGLGIVDGRAVALSLNAGSPRLHILGSGAATVDLAQLLDLDPEALFLHGWGVGPMGVALVLQEQGGPVRVVTSPDGVSFSVREVPLDEMAEPGQRATVNGVTVTADAIKVRVNVRDADDRSGGAPLAQVLYVGAPA